MNQRAKVGDIRVDDVEHFTCSGSFHPNEVESTRREGFSLHLEPLVKSETTLEVEARRSCVVFHLLRDLDEDACFDVVSLDHN